MEIPRPSPFRIAAATVLLAGCAAGGYLIGHSVADDASGNTDPASVAESVTAGIEEGAEQGYPRAYERARDRAYRTGYDAAYRAAYAEVFHKAGVGNPVHIEIQRGPIDRSGPATGGDSLSSTPPEDLPGGTD
jgi:hypothetical protein